ncbi:hypothetical protein KDW_16460 [Dictyobacter vulcani]|uniref:Putative sensor domain-containing protein n=1 Tax=Dictyobacter vulcani TaxID=2607529 RepID=A0A5J4KE63_9CHLR|nr:sensor domain-containing protein [Dictyobacter vulcani]GER87484.1 hypothetical protein KDW_16460 [Dictyobacter vulcani]
MAAFPMQQEYQHKQSTRQTLGNMLYLLLAFPLGLIYFVLMVVGLSVGASTLIIWIGLPILLLTMIGLRGDCRV